MILILVLLSGTSSSCSTSTTAGRATSANSHERPALSEAEEREYRLNEKRARCILDSGFDELQFAVRAVEVRQVEDLERMEREREREPDGESDV
ncbi:uncharacterized protein BDV17DRAFT_259515 [Aspergillus undulatus]|uniref:uncharacterized protein n=1 Tax=Aspergillus undulatus TaxID=1810928 RepID=UPI003CCD81BB